MLRTADKRLFDDLYSVLSPYQAPAISMVGTDTATSSTTPVPADASANTEGAWTELTSSSAIDADALWIALNHGNTASAAESLCDIGIGAGGAETVILENLPLSGKQNFLGSPEGFFPLRIPAGTRIAARCQSATGGTGLRVHMALVRGGRWAMLRRYRATTYGATTADSGGTGLDPGGSSHTKPATYTQITASTTNPIKEFMVCIGNRANASAANARWLLDLATGASSSEVDVIQNLPLVASITDDMASPMWQGPFPADIAAGTRLSARVQCSITDATDRLLDIIVVGFD